MSRDGAATPSVAARDDARASVGRWLPFASALARHGRFVDLAALGGVFGITALSYWWTRAPLYNPSGTIDPWLYTALFVNFDQFYDHFGASYYASRLPWIVPGRIVYGALSVDAAYWVLHGLSFVGGVAAIFFLVRRYLGIGSAVVGAATLALTPMYWNAQYWDYIDGITLTYLLAGLCFGLPLATGRARAVSLAAAGSFFAAAVTTNLFVALIALIYPIAYVFLQPAVGLGQRLKMAFADLAALLVGAAALVVAIGLHARANGGPFVFFEAQIEVVRTRSLFIKQPGYEWLRNEPRLLVPVFLLAVAAPLLIAGRRLPPFRFAAGSVAGLALLTSFIYGWEFFAGGNVLELPYYFSYFAISIALTMASVAALAVALARSRLAADAGVVAASIVAAVVALGLIYRNERAEWTGWAGAKISLALISLAAVLLVGFAVTRRTPVGTTAAVVSVGAIAFASHFAINSSNGTFVLSYSAPNNGSLYHAALDQLAFVKRSTTRDERLPTFWYAASNTDLIAIQSMYYWAFTYLDLALPKVTPTLRQRLDWFKPPTIVMLCKTRECGGGAVALRRAGYPYAEERAKLISRGRIRLWSVLLRSFGGPTTDARCEVQRLQDGDLLRAPPALEVYAFWAGRKHLIVSMDVLLDVFGPNAVPAVKNVLPRTLQVLPSGRSVTSAQVWAKVKAGSKDRRPRPRPC
jgi:hypothetical protein